MVHALTLDCSKGLGYKGGRGHIYSGLGLGTLYHERAREKMIP